MPTHCKPVSSAAKLYLRIATQHPSSSAPRSHHQYLTNTDFDAIHSAARCPRSMTAPLLLHEPRQDHHLCCRSFSRPPHKLLTPRVSSLSDLYERSIHQRSAETLGRNHHARITIRNQCPPIACCAWPPGSRPLLALRCRAGSTRGSPSTAPGPAAAE